MSLQEAKVKFGLTWRLQNFGDDVMVEYMPRKAANRYGISPKKRNVFQSTKLK